MAGWNLGLRFGVELSALTALGLAAYRATSGPLQWVAAIAAPLAAGTIWGVFNVLDDPSRSGKAPVEVPGWLRLGIELTILGAGIFAAAYAGQPLLATGLAILLALHYATSWPRVEWLIRT